MQPYNNQPPQGPQTPQPQTFAPQTPSFSPPPGPASSGSGFPSMPGGNAPFANQNPPHAAYPGIPRSPFQDQEPEPKRRISIVKVVALLCAFVLVVAVIVVIPNVPWQQLQSGSPTESSQNTTEANQQGTPAPTATPEPPGGIIEPLEDQIITGLSIPTSPTDFSVLDTFEQQTGKKVSMLLLYQSWAGTRGDEIFPVAWMDKVRERGSLAMITWEPWEPIAYPEGVNQPAYSLANIINGNFDEYIKKWAQDAKTWNKPFFLRFAPEMNGSWTPWSEGVNGNLAGEFILAWQHVHAIFQEVGAHNVSWIWSPNVHFAASQPLATLYPGDEYVDWNAMDGFNWGNFGENYWRSFTEVFASTYEELLLISSKPIMVGETGSGELGGDKAAWITSAYTVELPQAFPEVKAVVWFNQHTQQDWRVESSPTAMTAFTEAMKSDLYAANVFDNYYGVRS